MSEHTKAAIPAQSEDDRLRAENDKLRRQLRWANERNHERNVQLDALHFVWCDGGCYLGVHRFGDCDRPLTEETVLAAERNTERLRKWWNASRHRVKTSQPAAHDKAREYGRTDTADTDDAPSVPDQNGRTTP